MAPEDGGGESPKTGSPRRKENNTLKTQRINIDNLTGPKCQSPDDGSVLSNKSNDTGGVTKRLALRRNQKLKLKRLNAKTVGLLLCEEAN